MSFNEVLKLMKDFFQKSGPETQLRDLQVESAKSPDDLRLKLQIGKIYFKKKDVRNGIAVYREVAEKYIDENFILKAIAVYKEILKYSPGSVEFNEKLGDLFVKIGMAHDAAQQYQIAMHYYRTHAKPEEALKVAQKLVQAEPEKFQYRLRLAEVYYNRGMEEESLQAYEHVAEQLKRDGKHLEILADVDEKIYLKRPKNLNLLEELCQLYLNLQRPEKIIKRLEKMKLTQDERFQAFYQQALALKESPKELSQV